MILLIVGCIKIVVYVPVFWAGETTFFKYKISDIIKSKSSSAVNEEEDPKSKKHSLVFMMISKLNGNLDLSFYFSLIKSMEIDIFLNSWATMKSIGFLDFWSTSSNAILIFFFMNNLIYSILVFRIFVIYLLPKKKNKIKDENKGTEDDEGSNNKNKIKTKDGSDNENVDLLSFGEKSLKKYFKKSLRKESKYGILIFIAYSVRDMFLPLILVYLVEVPVIQLSAAIFFNLVVVLLLISTLPMASIFDTILEIYNSLTFLILLTLYSAIFYLKDDLSEENKSNYFGYPIILLLMVMTLINVVYGSIQGCIGAFDMVRKKKNKTKT